MTTLCKITEWTKSFTEISKSVLNFLLSRGYDQCPLTAETIDRAQNCRRLRQTRPERKTKKAIFKFIYRCVSLIKPYTVYINTFRSVQMFLVFVRVVVFFSIVHSNWDLLLKFAFEKSTALSFVKSAWKVADRKIIWINTPATLGPFLMWRKSSAVCGTFCGLLLLLSSLLLFLLLVLLLLLIHVAVQISFFGQYCASTTAGLHSISSIRHVPGMLYLVMHMWNDNKYIRLRLQIFFLPLNWSPVQSSFVWWF